MSLAIKFKNLSYNLYMILYNSIFKRKKSVVLIGGWMGLKFADNSRYLYQYLYENKSDLNISKVIWVTRDKRLNDKLNLMGYESYLIGTKESNYWHKVAGTHIICDAETNILNFLPDIDSKYSFNAQKIQLWHGVGVKSVGLASNSAQPAKYKSGILISFIHTILSEGGWYNKRFLCTSQKNIAINQLYMNDFHKNHYFISSYPRHCICPRLFEDELDVIKKMNGYNYSILYLPTFRNTINSYVHPLTNELLVKFLMKNNILWIEKEHSASNFKSNVQGKNILKLNSNFDINTILTYSNIVISDYSSVLFDAVHLNIPAIMYAPDFDEFKNGNVGFIVDPLEYFKGHMFCLEPNELIKNIDANINGTFYQNEELSSCEKLNKEFFENRYLDLSDIWKDIVSL